MSTETPEQFVARVKIEFENFYEGLWTAYVMDEPTHLFHYTSHEAVVGIISARKFFLADMLASTDQSEMQYGVQVLREVLEKDPEDPVASSFLAKFDANGKWGGIGTDFFVHAICFCCGSDILTQWRGFVPNGGFAIAVDFAALKERASRVEFALGRMLYDPERQRRIVQETLERGRSYVADLLRSLENAPEMNPRPFFKMIMQELGFCLLKSILLFKHPAFQSEDEWRLFKLLSWDEIAGTLKFRTRGTTIVPYVELPIEASLITEIRRAPGIWPQSAVYGVEQLAKSLGSHVRVSHSNIPL